MSKKTQQETVDLYLLHREFVRRNSEYATAYGEVQAIKNPNIHNFETALLAEHWGLSISGVMPDPLQCPGYEPKQLMKDAGLSMSRVIDSIMQTDPIETNAAFIVQEHLTATLHKLSQELRGFVVLLHLPEKAERPWGLDTIDLRRPKREIMRGIENLIDEAREQQELWPHKQKGKTIGGAKTRGFDYLKVYDLRKEGLRFKEIAIKVWGQSANELDDIQVKASKYYKRAKTKVQNPMICQSLVAELARRGKKRSFKSIHGSPSLPLIWGKRAWLKPVCLWGPGSKGG